MSIKIIDFDLPVIFKAFQVTELKEIKEYRVCMNWYDIIRVEEFVYPEDVPQCKGGSVIITVLGEVLVSEKFENLANAFIKYKDILRRKNDYFNYMSKNN